MEHQIKAKNSAKVCTLYLHILNIIINFAYEFLNNKIMQPNQNSNIMQNQNLQPVPQLTALLNAIQNEIYDNAHNTPNLKIQPTTLTQQIIEAGDNSAMLNLAITFNAPDSNDACDFADEALAIARYELYNHAIMLSDAYNLGETVTRHLSNSYHLYNHIDELIYFNATITITDCTIYISCIYNQQ